DHQGDTASQASGRSASRVRPVPSAATISISVPPSSGRPTNATRAPSGDQSGRRNPVTYDPRRDSTSPGATRRSVTEPSAATETTAPSAASASRRRPSGDQLGATGVVMPPRRLRRPVPSASTMANSSDPVASVKNATRCPSGDQTGASPPTPSG